MDRPRTFPAGGLAVELPCFFPSVSSVRTNMQPVEYLRLLAAMRHPLLLISAYDIYNSTPEAHEEIAYLLEDCRKRGQVSLLDSGNYERYWKADDSWTREAFHRILENEAFPLAFCYDNIGPPASVDAISADVESSVLNDQQHTAGTVIPIIHGRSEVLPLASQNVISRLRPLMIAVAERDLGDGVIERANTVAKIRSRLNQLDYYCPLHLLGTGNPLSILIYVISGADSFDGLEWCQTVADHESGRLFHFQHWDLFAEQTPVKELSSIPYPDRVLAHNLIFYSRWMTAIREAALADETGRLLARCLPSGAANLFQKFGTELI